MWLARTIFIGTGLKSIVHGSSTISKNQWCDGLKVKSGSGEVSSRCWITVSITMTSLVSKWSGELKYSAPGILSEML